MIFSRTNSFAEQIASNNANSEVYTPESMYEDDLFELRAHSRYIAPVLSYITNTQGYGSIFVNFTLVARPRNDTFIIINADGRFRKLNLAKIRNVHRS